MRSGRMNSIDDNIENNFVNKNKKTNKIKNKHIVLMIV